MLSVKLPYLEDWNSKRIEHADLMKKLLIKGKFILPVVNNNARHVFHLFVIRHEKRDALKKYLTDKGIETAVHYPVALPFLKAYSKYSHERSDFPVAYDETQKVLSLPMFPELSQEQIAFIVDCLLKFDAGS